MLPLHTIPYFFCLLWIFICIASVAVFSQLFQHSSPFHSPPLRHPHSLAPPYLKCLHSAFELSLFYMLRFDFLFTCCYCSVCFTYFKLILVFSFRLHFNFNSIWKMVGRMLFWDLCGPACLGTVLFIFNFQFDLIVVLSCVLVWYFLFFFVSFILICVCRWRRLSGGSPIRYKDTFKRNLMFLCLLIELTVLGTLLGIGSFDDPSPVLALFAASSHLLPPHAVRLQRSRVLFTYYVCVCMCGCVLLLLFRFRNWSAVSGNSFKAKYTKKIQKLFALFFITI